MGEAVHQEHKELRKTKSIMCPRYFVLYLGEGSMELYGQTVNGPPSHSILFSRVFLICGWYSLCLHEGSLFEFPPFCQFCLLCCRGNGRSIAESSEPWRSVAMLLFPCNGVCEGAGQGGEGARVQSRPHPFPLHKNSPRHRARVQQETERYRDAWIERERASQ